MTRSLPNMADSGGVAATPDEHGTTISDRRRKQLEAVDNMPGPLRACVHEYGFSIVTRFVQCGIKDPNKIRSLVHECWLGARNGGGGKSQRAKGIIPRIDDFLFSHGVELRAIELLRFFQQCSLAVVPIEPTETMVAASLAEVTGGNVVCSKTEKHRRRIRASTRAQMDYWLKASEQSA